MAADLQQLAVASFAIKTCSLGKKLETCSICAARQVGKFQVLVCLKCSVGALSFGRGCRFARPDLFCKQNPADWPVLGWLSTQAVLDFGRFAMLEALLTLQVGKFQCWICLAGLF